MSKSSIRKRKYVHSPLYSKGVDGGFDVLWLVNDPKIWV